MDDPFRSRPLVTLSSASSALGIFNLITNCPNVTRPTPSCAARFRFSTAPFPPPPPALPPPPPVPLFLARDPMKNSRRSIATELLAGRLYLWRSFSWRSRRSGRNSSAISFSLSLSPARFFSHSSLPHLVNYLLIPRLISPMLSVLLSSIPNQSTLLCPINK